MFGERKKQIKSEAPRRAQHLWDFISEETRIQFLRDGTYTGPAAWVGPGFERTKPWDLPESFNIDGLEPFELRVAVRLGILTREVLTAVQSEKYESVINEPMPKGTALSLMSKLAMRAANE